MTIYEAVSAVLSENQNGLTVEEIYNQIIEKGLYKFGAKDPVNIVYNQIRRRCEGLNYSYSSKERLFKITGKKNNKTVYSLIDSNNIPEESNGNSTTPLDVKIEELKKRISVLEKEYVEAISELESLEFERSQMKRKQS